MPNQEIKLCQITCTPDRDPGDISSLAHSIKKMGLLQPIILRQISDDRYEVVDGRRRFAALQQLGWTAIGPAEYKMWMIPDNNAAVIAHVANVERKQLTPAEEVKHLIDLAKTHTGEQLAEIFGRTPGWIARRLKIAKLIPKWLKVLDDPERAPFWPLEKLALIARQSEYIQGKILWMVNRGESFSIEQINHQINQYNYQISTATFDTSECAKCRDNTATQELLFDDTDATAGKCMNEDCWMKKSLAKVKTILKTEKLIPIKGNNSSYNDPDSKYADKIKAEYEWYFDSVRAPKKGETANAIIVSGDGIGRRVFAVKRKETAAAKPAEKKPLTVKEQEAVLKKKRTKKALELLREKFAEKDFVEKFIAGEEKGALLDHFLLCLSLWGFHGECFQHYGIRIDKKAAANVIDLETFFPKKFYPQLVAHITEAMRCELTKTLNGINPEAGPALCQLFKLDWNEFYQSASIAVPEPKCLTEAKAKRKNRKD